MLVKKLLESKDLIENFLYEKENTHNITTLGVYKGTVERFLDELKDINKVIFTLQDINNIEISQELKMLARLLEKLNVDLNQVDLNLDAINQTNRTYQVSNSIRKLDSEYKVVWIKYYEQKYEPILNLLDMLKTLKTDPEIFTLAHKIKTSKIKWPISKLDLEDFEISHKKAVGKIEKLELTTKIEVFLNKLIKGDGYLSDLDEEIVEWVNKVQIEDKIKLGI